MSESNRYITQFNKNYGYVVQIPRNSYTKRYVGIYDTIEEARVARDEALLKLEKYKNVKINPVEQTTPLTYADLEESKAPSSISIGGTSFTSSEDIDTSKPKVSVEDKRSVVNRRVPYNWQSSEAPDIILIMGDIHFPYHHQDAIDFLEKTINTFRPDVIVNVGDEIDSNALSFYPQNPALHNATTELKYARECLKDLDSVIGSIPVLSCESNHTSRMYRKAKNAGIPKDLILPYEQALGVDWEWHKDIVLPMTNKTDIMFSHTKGNNTLLAGQQSGMNLVCGHFHKRANIMYWTDMRGQEYFVAQCPCLIDFDSPAYSYDENSANRPVLGAMVIVDSRPYIIIMSLDSKGRWDGQVLGV